MIKYGDLVQFIKDNHINWNTDLFDVLRGFFESQKYSPQPFFTLSSSPIQQELVFQSDSNPYKTPDNGEYTIQDVLNLFNA